MYPLIAIVGPTASGKSHLGLWLAGEVGGEIVNYDSVQMYRGFDIGTAKPSPREQAQVPHHLIDICEPEELFTAGDYQREAAAALSGIRERNRVPILAGGTGLYLRALVYGLFAGPARSERWRERFERIAGAKGREYLHRVLIRFDPVAAERIAPRDTPKVIRALEVRLETGKALTAHWRQQIRTPLAGYRVIWIGLNPPRSELFQRINTRVPRMFDSGLVAEVASLLARGVSRYAKPMESIGYRHALAFIEGRCTLSEAVDLAQRDTRRYAKRQMTWFRKEVEVQWFDGPGDKEKIKREVYQVVNSLAVRSVVRPGSSF